jgi:N-acetylneuraminic acid mutarotase
LRDAPVPRLGACAGIITVAHGGSKKRVLHVMGGSDSKRHYFNSVCRYDIDANEWLSSSSSSSSRMHRYRWCAACVVLPGQRLFVVGGYDGRASALRPLRCVEEYDAARNAWRLNAIAPMAVPRTRAASCVVLRSDSKGNSFAEIFIIGGYNVHQKHAFRSVEVYSMRTQSWRFVAPLNVRRYGACAAVHNGTVHVSGGKAGSTYRSSTEGYAAAHDTWCILSEPLGVPRSAAVMAQLRIH